VAPIVIQADPALSWPLVIQEWGDLLRLFVVPLFVWTAYHDIKTRRVPNWVWKPPFVLGIVLFAWEGWQAFQAGGYGLQLFLVAAGISLFIVIPLAVGFHLMGGFGAADMKALVVIAVLFPTYPSYIVPHSTLTFPMVESPVNAFALTALTNGVLVGIAYPLALVVHNLLTRSIPEEPWVLLVGRAVEREDVLQTHGRLLETTHGYTRAGLDLDALRMYLAWRDCDLAELVEDPATARDPTSLPEEPGRVGGGAVTDGGRDVADDGDQPASTGGGHVGDPSSIDDEDDLSDDTDPKSGADRPQSGAVDSQSRGDDLVQIDDGDRIEDPWGAEAFLEDIPGSAYGTTPALLREGLDVLTSEERVWVSPGIPFLVPLVIGLLVSLVYGDALVAGLRAIGLLPGF
jgi:preflagellin peptidase FlaK